MASSSNPSLLASLEAYRRPRIAFSRAFAARSKHLALNFSRRNAFCGSSVGVGVLRAVNSDRVVPLTARAMAKLREDDEAMGVVGVRDLYCERRAATGDGLWGVRGEAKGDGFKGR